MHRYLATGLLLWAHGAFAAGASGVALITTPPLDMPITPAQVMPPLPSLASLPPPVEAPPARATRTHGRRAPRVTAHLPPPVEVRTIVSDESQAFLAELDTRLDEALAR